MKSSKERVVGVEGVRVSAADLKSIVAGVDGAVAAVEVGENTNNIASNALSNLPEFYGKAPGSFLLGRDPRRAGLIG